jgi:hypothetical protein
MAVLFLERTYLRTLARRMTVMLFLVVTRRRSAQPAHFVRNLRHRPHFLHVVHPHNMRAMQDRSRHRRRRRVNRFAV